MRTIYIKGRGQYKRGIRRGLDKSKLVEGVDFVEGSGSSSFALIWIREDLAIRELKLAIGAKYVWKHRLKFYASIDEMNPPKKDIEPDDVYLDLCRLRHELLYK